MQSKPYNCAVYTNVGIKKKINQDSLIVLEADCPLGNILLAAVCDGMGGLAAGEHASKIMVEHVEAWFENTLPTLIDQRPLDEAVLRKSLLSSIYSADSAITDYGSSIDSDCGTTATILMLTPGHWYAANVGDSRLYILEDSTLRQETVDHSYIQREMDAGRLTAEQAKVSKMRNVLTQCIGAGDVVMPDWYSGKMIPGTAFLLCSDGFRHINTLETLEHVMRSEHMNDEISMTSQLSRLGDKAMAGGEQDNLTAVLVVCNN